MLVRFISLTAISLSFSAWCDQESDELHAFKALSKTCSNQRIQQQADNNLKRQLDTQTNWPSEGSQKRITKIVLKQLNVFDTSLPEEDNALFRFANKAHMTTEPDVIMSTLLFKEGEAYSIQTLEESERLLRQQSYLYDARVFAEEDCKDEIHVTVVTRDLWTLLPDISFSRSGGENTSRLGFRESNLFGWGKRLSLTYTEDKDRTGALFVYDDPNILSSRYRGRLEFADNSDGKRHYIGASYPFFSIDTPYSYGFYSYRNERVESLYKQGEVSSEFSHDTSINNAYYGIAEHLRNNWTKRIIFGFQNEKHHFKAISLTTLPIADNRSISYPYIQTQWLQNNYIKVRNFDSIYRTEDLNLGWNINTLIGYSDEQLSNDDSHFIYQISANKAHFTSDKSLWRIKLALNGQWNSQLNTARNLFSELSLQYYLNTSIQQSWYANLHLRYAKNLTEDKQLTLGGETGLRGYPIHYQQGTRSALLNIEKRYYWEYDLFQLFKVGGALFFDMGKVSGGYSAINNPFLHNFGMGLRLAPSRANAGIVLHLDIAAPLAHKEEIDKVQWIFTVKNRF